MAPLPTPAPPGNLTVPPLFGFSSVAVAVLVVLVLAGLAFLLLAAGRGASERPGWQAWLDARSGAPDQDSETPSR